MWCTHQMLRLHEARASHAPEGRQACAAHGRVKPVHKSFGRSVAARWRPNSGVLG
jgi:hypothetical protein